MHQNINYTNNLLNLGYLILRWWAQIKRFLHPAGDKWSEKHNQRTSKVAVGRKFETSKWAKREHPGIRTEDLKTPFPVTGPSGSECKFSRISYITSKIYLKISSSGIIMLLKIKTLTTEYTPRYSQAFFRTFFSWKWLHLASQKKSKTLIKILPPYFFQ